MARKADEAALGSQFGAHDHHPGRDDDLGRAAAEGNHVAAASSGDWPLRVRLLDDPEREAHTPPQALGHARRTGIVALQRARRALTQFACPVGLRCVA